MNLKPSLWKIVISIISFFIVDVLLSASVNVACMCVQGRPCNCQPQFYAFMREPMFLLISLAVAAVVYLVISFLQKKK